jgi:transcriptional regulator with XRE-family HTH domain
VGLTDPDWQSPEPSAVEPELAGEAFRRARLAAGLRQLDLAEAAGVALSTVTYIEGGYVPALAAREHFAAVLSVDVDELFPVLS